MEGSYSSESVYCFLLPPKREKCIVYRWCNCFFSHFLASKNVRWIWQLTAPPNLCVHKPPGFKDHNHLVDCNPDVDHWIKFTS
jgi:hypothetical protein